MPTPVQDLPLVFDDLAILSNMAPRGPEEVHSARGKYKPQVRGRWALSGVKWSQARAKRPSWFFEEVLSVKHGITEFAFFKKTSDC